MSFGYLNHNDATTFFGLSFSILSSICYLLIHRQHIVLARILWALLSPILLSSSIALFKVREPAALFNYGYLYIGGLLFCSFPFKAKKEWPILVASNTLFVVGYLSYDYIIIYKSFPNSDQISFYLEHQSYLKTAQLMHLVTILAFILLLQKNRYTIERMFLEKIDKLNRFTSNLIESSKSKLIISSDLKGSLEEIIKNTSEVLSISRMSVWEYQEQQDSIQLVVAYDNQGKSFSYEGELLSKDYPNYFKSILAEETIAAYDAQKDRRTSEFNKGYLVKHDIKSMLDTPFFIDGKFKGILCFEEKHQYRQWDEMDRLYSMSISKLVSISYYWADKRKRHLETLRLSADLKNKNGVLESVNKKIYQLNEELASHLKGKENDIHELQNFFQDISFKNAHMVRAPLCRIIGLIKLYNLDPDEKNKKTYFKYLEDASNDLDKIISEISEILNKTYLT